MTLPRRVLISPLCASMRIGCARGHLGTCSGLGLGLGLGMGLGLGFRGHLGTVLVEKRRW